MDEYLPEVYLEFTRRFPEVADAQGELARTVDDATPFDERTTRLLKLALAVGAEADGAVRSNVRKSLTQGVTEAELRAVALLAITTCGFPTAVAGLRWIDEVLAREAAAE
jgi:4-carboxymuconolactone decarboxylase